MLLEYMPFRACEPVLKTILSVSVPPLAAAEFLHVGQTPQGMT